MNSHVEGVRWKIASNSCFFSKEKLHNQPPHNYDVSYNYTPKFLIWLITLFNVVICYNYPWTLDLIN